MTLCEPQSGGKILCIRLSGLGDVVHCLNALSLLRQYRPNAHITWIVEERFEGVLDEHPYIDELITVPRKSWGQRLRNPMRWAEVVPELAELALLLRRERFDVSLDFQSSVKSAWLVAAAGATLRVGFAPPISREVNWLAQNKLVSVPRTGIHRIERDLALLSPLGIPMCYAAPILPSPESTVGEVDELCREMPRPLVLMHPGTSAAASFKRWVPARYSEVADRLVAERGAGVLVTWGPGERGLAEQVAARAGSEVVLAPELEGQGQLVRALRQADLFIGSDTGPMHVASALQVPTVALFGPKDPEQTGPYCGRSAVVTAPVDCRPCTKRRCDDVRCMKDITAEQVFHAALELLDGRGQRRAADGPIRKPCATEFDLGRWHGRINASYSVADFYRWLCEVEAEGMHAGEVEPWRHRLWQGAFGRTEKLLVRRLTPGKGGGLSVGRYWRAALGLLRAGVPARMPVCLVVTGSVLKGCRILVAEDLPGAVTLSHALRDAPEPERGALIDEVARLVQGAHRAGFTHGDLTPESILVRDGRLYLERLDCAWHARWKPALVRVLLAGLELRHLLTGMRPMLSPQEQERLVSRYCAGHIESLPGRRLLGVVLGRRVAGPQGLEGTG